MPTKTERLLIESLEDQAALINRYLDRLMRDLERATTSAKIAEIQAEITYELGELGRVHRLRDAIKTQLAQTEGKKKRKGNA